MTTLEDGCFADLEKLKTLKLRENNIANLNMRTLLGLTNLKTIAIDLKKNFAVNVPREFFSFAPKLANINGSYFKINSSAFDPKQLKNMRKLELIHMPFPYVDQEELFDLIEDMTNLEYLNVEHNNIEFSKLDILFEMKSLTTLKMIKGNNFTNNCDTVKALVQLKTMDIIQVSSAYNDTIKHGIVYQSITSST